MSKVKLGDIAEIQAGPFGTQLHKEEYVKNGIVMLNAKNIGNGVIIKESIDYVSEAVCDRLPRYVLKKGDILFGRAGSIERHAYITNEFEGCFQGTNCIRIRCKSPEIALYVSYYLWLPELKQIIENQTGGSILSYITTDLLKDLEVDLPNEKTIDLVADILSELDRKVELNKRINDNLQQQLKLMYNYWFTQFDFPDGNGHPYQSSGGTMIYSDTAKRAIPDGWKVESVLNNSLSQVIKPGVERFDKKVYLATAEVNRTNISAGNIIEYETRESRANMQPTEYSVWFAKMKNSIKHLYLNKEMRPFIENSILSTGFCGLQCTKCSFEYMASFIEYSYFETIKDILAHGATQEAVNNADLSEIILIVPSEPVLRLYHERTRAIYSQISKNICENRELINIREWLLPMLMNGQAVIAD